MNPATPPWEGEPCFPADSRPRPVEIVSVTRRDGVVQSWGDYKAWEKDKDRRRAVRKERKAARRDRERRKAMKLKTEKPEQAAPTEDAMAPMRRALAPVREAMAVKRERAAKAPGRPLDASWLLDGLEAAHAALDALAGSPEAEECRRLLAELGERVRNAGPAVVKVSVPARPGNRPKPPRPDGRHYMPFGRYKDKLVADVAIIDPEYLAWMYQKCQIGDSLRREVARLLNAGGKYRVKEG